MTCIFRKFLEPLLYVIRIYDTYFYAICSYDISTFTTYNYMKSRNIG